MLHSANQSMEDFAPKYGRAAKISDGLDEDFGILYFASECHPWMAAFDYMKWVYLSCFVLMLFCITVVVHVLDKTDKKRLEIEENRRNFTHTLALKMEQPLDTIRGLKENLVNSGTEECLNRIIAETETMDHLVGEMIDMSKLDSEHLVFQKDNLSMGDIIREQLTKFEKLIVEQQLSIQIEETAVFTLTGDKKYMSKAIYNLLDNAVRYSDVGGTIRVVIDSKYCSIENTCPPTEIHPGAGLYLVQKILHLCQLTMEIQSTDKGIKIVIR